MESRAALHLQSDDVDDSDRFDVRQSEYDDLRVLKGVEQPDRKGESWTSFVIVNPNDVPAHSLNVSEQFAVVIVLSHREYSFHGMLHVSIRERACLGK